MVATKVAGETQLFNSSLNMTHGMFDETWLRAYNEAGGIMGAAGEDRAEVISVTSRAFEVRLSIMSMDDERRTAMVKASAFSADEALELTAFFQWQGWDGGYEEVKAVWSSRNAPKQPAAGDPGIHVRGTWVQVDSGFVHRVVNERAVNPYNSVWSDEELAPVVQSVNLFTQQELPKEVVRQMARRGFVTSHHLFTQQELAPSGRTIFDCEDPENFGWSTDVAMGYLSEMRQCDEILRVDLMDQERDFHESRRRACEREFRKLLMTASVEWRVFQGGYRKTWTFPDHSQFIGEFRRHGFCYYTMVDEENPLEYNVRF